MKARVSACMIVRNEEKSLVGAIESMEPWVREVVVVDTGSTDDTVAVAKKAGARVKHFEWCDDFSAARNASLNYARQPWILVMDADDRVLPEFGKRLKALCASEIWAAGFVLQAREVDLEGNEVRTGYQAVRLFRNLPHIRYEGRVHEHVLHKGEWVELDRGPHFVHWGHDVSLIPEKLKRNLRLALLMYEDDPLSVDALFELVRVYTKGGIEDDKEKQRWITRCIMADPDRERFTRRQWEFLDAATVGII